MEDRRETPERRKVTRGGRRTADVLALQRLVGERISRQMRRLGYTDKRMSDLADVAEYTIRRVKRGESTCLGSLHAIAVALGTTVRDLVAPPTTEENRNI